eukprot:TRINITY_DN26517_c0_g1_i1.p1 TRINITY_DN26517_c0_g1~~TRINITY_DN26517_c0_g1_i1.p1  ORF type:complete len:211 (+),score=21.17 TRINITY_DN26517_c0_g1_i1:41-634(+)
MCIRDSMGGVFSSRQLTAVQKMTCVSNNIRALSLLQDRGVLVSGGAGRQLKLWNYKEGTLIKEIENVHTGPIQAIIRLHDNDHIASVGEDHRVCIVNRRTNTLVKSFTQHASHVYGLAIIKDGKSFITGGRSGKVIVWDAIRKEPQRTFLADGPVWSVGSVCRGRIVVSGDEDSQLNLWEWTKGCLLYTSPSPRDQA